MLYRGYTLFSLLLSLSLSSFLLLIFISFYVHSQRQNQPLFLQLQLQSELQHVARLIAKDIRRAGFRAFSTKIQQTNFSLFEQEQSSL
ncbi:membrane protein [Pasteurella canis]|nr:membrane protein [Pasteurella canis]